jgi:hypothetical protein
METEQITSSLTLLVITVSLKYFKPGKCQYSKGIMAKKVILKGRVQGVVAEVTALCTQVDRFTRFSNKFK